MGVGEEMPQHLSRQIVSCILLDSLCGPYRNWAPVVTLATNIFYWLSSLFSSLADSYTLFIGTIYQRNHLQLQCCLRIYFWKPKLRYLNYKVLVFLFSGVFSFEYFLSFLLEHLRNELFCWLFEKIFFFFIFWLKDSSCLWQIEKWVSLKDQQSPKIKYHLTFCAPTIFLPQARARMAETIILISEIIKLIIL